MKKSIISIITCIACVAVLSSCGESDVITPHGSTAVPAQVTVSQVVNYAGKSVIYYKLPNDINLKYVKASYSPRPNETAEVKASFYTDSLTVEGFKTSGDYTVSLTSVSYGETASQPVKVTVSPKEPAYLDTYSKINCTETFGGVYVMFDNANRDDLAITVRKKNEAGVWIDLYTHYTSAANGTFSVRGQEAVESTFGIVITDRWGNTSAVKEITMTPWYELECDKSKFAKMTMAGDTYLCHTWNELSKLNDMTRLWDGEVIDTPCFQTKTNVSMPQHFTFDLGDTYQLSRFVLWTRRTTGNLYKAGHIRKFELYGSAEPNPDGTLFKADGTLDESWFLISAYESFRPSGETVAQSSASPLTDDDKAVLDTGEEFMIPENMPKVRYIRIRSTLTWGKTVYIHLAEVSFFGQPSSTTPAEEE